MTTNQQIDKIISTLYNKQVKQNLDWTQLPNYDLLCTELFVDIPDLSERQYQNLLYMLVSKRLINTHAETKEETYYKPISLRPEVIEWYGQFHSYLDYLDYLEEKRQPKAFKEDLDEDIDSEVTERKSIWATIPVWAKLLLLIGVIAIIAIVIMGSDKE
ncbi:hypothetical protein [Emticicia sp. C21]|uniref:hypothetical protein n=1 Tax=Emticicia sp. C21 TaxID=2302915 RepID=UPI000E356F10|nr:hypothetical protein [Emticicia sp. C21]RFS15078.1 hypothetical protein D0T08_18550 [Emticicia sp. C21]